MQAANRDSLLDAALELHERARLWPEEVASRLEHAMSPAYWAKLAGEGWDDGSATDAVEATPHSTEQIDDLRCQLAREGYFQIPGLLSSRLVRWMRACIEALVREGWPPVFAFVYDKFWQVSRGPALSNLLSAALGPDYWQLPNIWAHYVHPGTAGWDPHVDGRHGAAKLSVWIPFGDATLDNGCMYLLPKNAVTERIGRLLPILKTVSRRDLFVLLQSSRALPASAGSVLGWESGVIHWGSSSESAASQARASVALEFIRDGIKEPKPKVPFVDPRGALPAFERRLNMIGRAIVSYEEFEPRMLRYSELARRLVRETDLLS